MPTEQELQAHDDEFSIYDKLLSKLNEDLDVEVKKFLSMIRQIIITEQTIERLKKPMELPKPEVRSESKSEPPIDKYSDL